jgi:methionyl-tRNA formyltransferase
VKALRAVFLGSDSIALPLLEWLGAAGNATAEVVGVFTQPDRPAGRGQQVTANPIKQWALARGLPVLQPVKITDEVRRQLQDWRADVALVMAYGHMLKDDFIGTPRLGTLNLHTSKLPRYRGASPIQTAVAAGETATAVTLMRIVRELDAGPVAGAETVAIDPLDTALEVEKKLAAACVPLLARTLPKLAAGGLEFTAQNPADATYCRKLRKEDGTLDFNAPAASLAARINGLFPWPACAVNIDGVVIKLGQAEAAGTQAGAKPGTVCGADAQGLLVATGAGMLRLRRLQRPGGRMLPAGEFLRGFPLSPGIVLPSQPMAPLVAPQPFRR